MQINPQPSPSSQTSGSVYKNDTYGFKVTYDNPYRLLTDKDSLSGYPHGLALLYTGGQAYDIVIEVWNSKAEYESEYGPRVSDLTVVENKGKFITLLDNTDSSANQQIIDSLVVTP